MKRQILNTFIIALPIAAIILFFYACGGEEIVTTNNNTNPDCGSHHELTYGPFLPQHYTNTFLENGTTRVFQYSAIPLTTIDSICTHGKPVASGRVTWITSDTSHPFSVRLVVQQDPLLNPYSTNGTVVLNGNYQWDGNINVGLVQSYGNGPGMIYDLRTDVRFRTLGSLQQDTTLLTSRGVNCYLSFIYESYKAP